MKATEVLGIKLKDTDFPKKWVEEFDAAYGRDTTIYDVVYRIDPTWARSEHGEGELTEAVYKLLEPYEGLTLYMNEAAENRLEAWKKHWDSKTKVTDEEKVKVYENVLRKLYFATSVTLDGKKAAQIVDAIANWAFAARDSELTEDEQNERIQKSFEALKAI